MPRQSRGRRVRSPPRSTRSSSGLESGGRLVYVGAGTSGRIAAADAAECGPTFSTDLIRRSRSRTTPTRTTPSSRSSLSTSATSCSASAPADGRRTPSALSPAGAEAGALTIGLACVRGSELARAADLAIEIDVGPEVISGSTRMKAGTAQKLVLNTISTVTMVKLGKTFGNLMVDVQPANEKLRARARTAVAIATAASGGRSRRRDQRSGRRHEGRDRLVARGSRCGDGPLTAERRGRRDPGGGGGCRGLRAELREQPRGAERFLAAETAHATEIARGLIRDDVHYLLIVSRGSSSNVARYMQYLFGTANRLPSLSRRLRSTPCTTPRRSSALQP